MAWKMREDDREVLQRTIVAGLPGLGLFGLVWLFAWALRDNVVSVFLVVLGFGVFFDVYRTVTGQAPRSGWRLVKNTGYTLVFLWVVYWLNFYLGGYGFLGFVLLCVVLAGYIIVSRWGLYMSWVRHIERRYFGMTAEERKRKRRDEEVR